MRKTYFGDIFSLLSLIRDSNRNVSSRSFLNSVFEDREGKYIFAYPLFSRGIFTAPQRTKNQLNVYWEAFHGVDEYANKEKFFLFLLKNRIDVEFISTQVNGYTAYDVLGSYLVHNEIPEGSQYILTSDWDFASLLFPPKEVVEVNKLDFVSYRRTPDIIKNLIYLSLKKLFINDYIQPFSLKKVIPFPKQIVDYYEKKVSEMNADPYAKTEDIYSFGYRAFFDDGYFGRDAVNPVCNAFSWLIPRQVPAEDILRLSSL